VTDAAASGSQPMSLDKLVTAILVNTVAPHLARSSTDWTALFDELTYWSTPSAAGDHSAVDRGAT
jgi:hypothetical protein